MKTTTKQKWQIQYQSNDHPKGPDYWQTTRTFKTREAAELAASKTRSSCPDFRVRVITKP